MWINTTQTLKRVQSLRQYKHKTVDANETLNIH